ncbi:ROK family protein, partial [Shewanella sp. C31]|nr:ROK family protein [Shewanella electrica]
GLGYLSPEAVNRLVRLKARFPLSPLDLEDLLRQAREGEALALEAIRHLGEGLGRFLANLAVAYDPALVVVGGKAAEFFPFLEASLRQSLEAHAFVEAHRARPGR